MFDALSEDLGGFREKIAPGAFTRTLKNADVRALFNHDSNYVLGRNTSGTLTLSEDLQGLAIQIEPPDTSWARDLIVSMQRGDINQMSFQFSAIKDGWESGEDGGQIRTLKEVKLYDVSVVTFPAYPQTDVSVRELLAEAGINYDRIAEIARRRASGFGALTAEDAVAVRHSIDALQAFLADYQPEPELVRREAQSDPPEPGHSLALYRLKTHLRTLLAA